MDLFCTAIEGSFRNSDISCIRESGDDPHVHAGGYLFQWAWSLGGNRMFTWGYQDSMFVQKLTKA